MCNYPLFAILYKNTRDIENIIMLNWFIRFIKGFIIGSGFIVPGVSGGALAAVFGVYERIIKFLAHITKDFINNVLYLIPLGLGGVTGIFVFSFLVNFLLVKWESYIMWLFIGCIVGTVPVLWKQAGKKGREKSHIFILILSFVLSFILLFLGESLISGGINQNFFTWVLAGALICLGIIVPGLSSSSFLVYMGLYKPMTEGIKTLDFAIIIPIILGGIICLVLFSKLMDFIFKKYYTILFHCILGIVFASTVIIIPIDFNYLSFSVFLCIIYFLIGFFIGYIIGYMEKKSKKIKMQL